MLIVMQNTASKQEITAVCQKIVELGFEAHQMPGAQRMAVCVTGNDGSVSERHFSGLSGIRQIIRVSKPYKLTSNEIKTTPTIVEANGVKFGSGHTGLIAGPACVEAEEVSLRLAQAVAEQGIKLFRAAAFRPHYSPYQFQGLGQQAMAILEKIKLQFGLGIVSEVTDIDSVEVLREVADMLIVDSHNMQNYRLLRRLGKLDLPVILKRGHAATLEAHLMAAEYILAGGNNQVILCDAGIQSFGEHSAYALDMNYVPAIQRLTHLPVIVDPSQASGSAYMVPRLIRAALALGADGVMIECHDDPTHSATGGAQSILPEQLP